MIKRSLRVLLLACLATAPCWAADNPFVGDWKLNPSKSTLTDKMTVESAGGNKYTLNFGGGPETIVVDGTDQPSPLYKGGTLAVAVEGDNWKVIRKQDGRTTISATWSLSDAASQFTGNVNFAASLVRRPDEHTLELMRKKSDGELSVRMQLKVSSDLKTLTITPPSVSVDEPHIFVFDRQ